jgi:thiopurine S-methyltransferase
LESTKDLQAFVPLCGDSPAVKYLLEAGFSVTALDVVAEALEGLRNSIRNELPSALPKLQILCEDIFTHQAKTQFDFIYDRAALVAIVPNLQEKYAQHLLKMLAPGGLYFLDTFTFEEEKSEPPFSVPPKLAKSLFQDLTCISEEELESKMSQSGKTVTRHILIFQAQ